MREYLNIGADAPDFTSIDQNGNSLSLSDFKGKKIALYFYPEDDTPGCTLQACNVRDNIQALKDKNIVILGVSIDGQDSHHRFSEKFQLNFPLVVDTDKNIVNAYKVYGEKNLYGNITIGTYRVTYLIDENGKIKHIIKKVKVAEHAQQIIDAFEKVK